VVALAAVAAVWGVAPSGADVQSKRGLEEQIKIKLGNQGPKFVGPDTIISGSDLRIINLTDPEEAGPHTFSLVKKSALPTTENQREQCGSFHLVCKQIRKAHGLLRRDFVAENPDIDNGAEGWDAKFDGDDDEGDSVYLATENEDEVRNVPAIGKFFYMCAISPKMQGRITFTAP
jgi:hypothetical protein